MVFCRESWGVQLDQFTGLQGMQCLTQAGGDAARLAALAGAAGVLAADADADLAGWEGCLLGLRGALSGRRISAELACRDCGEGVYEDVQPLDGHQRSYRSDHNIGRRVAELPAGVVRLLRGGGTVRCEVDAVAQ